MSENKNTQKRTRKIDFIMHKSLLRGIFFEQGGNKTKAIMELLQNGLDEESTIIKIKLTNNGMVVENDGRIMTEKEILENFMQFGDSYKRGMKNKIGEKNMGRGQVFAVGYTTYHSGNNRMMVDANKDFSYRLRYTDVHYNGTVVYCVFYKTLDNYDLKNVSDRIKKIVIPMHSPLRNVKIYLNETRIGVNTNKDTEKQDSDDNYGVKMNIIGELSDDEFKVFKSNFTGRIYSQGMYVKSFDTTTECNISCLNKMELNQARNVFIEDAESTKKLELIKTKLEEKYLLEKTSYSEYVGKKALEFMTNGRIKSIDKFRGRKLIQMVDGSFVSLNDVVNMKIMFGKKDRYGDQAMQQGFNVVSDEFKSVLSQLANDNVVKLDIDPRVPRDVVRRGYEIEIPLEELKKYEGLKSLQLYYMACEMNKRMFNGRRRIGVMVSDHARACTDGYTHILLNVTIFKDYESREQVVSRIFESLIHEYAHTSSDYEEVSHDANFYKNYVELNVRHIEQLGYFHKYIPISWIKEEYGDKIDEVSSKAKNYKRPDRLN